MEIIAAFGVATLVGIFFALFLGLANDNDHSKSTPSRKSSDPKGGCY